jgi:hypothetical protein
VRHASARSKGMPLSVMASALSRDTQCLRAAGVRFSIHLHELVFFPSLRPELAP